MSSSTLNISNGGSDKIRISGGTLTSPVDVLSGNSQSATATDTQPLTITVLPVDSGGLAGGHGEEG